MGTQRQRAIRKLDKVFSLFIRKRDTENGYGKCCSCSRVVPYESMDAGHFINRRFQATRWREDNVHAQCRACNRFQEGNPAGYALFMLDKYGKAHIEYLQALSQETAKFTLSELDLLIKDYQSRV